MTLFIGKYSLCFYLFHVFLLQFYEIKNLWLYIAVIIFGCVLLTLIYVKFMHNSDKLNWDLLSSNKRNGQKNE